MVYVLSLIALFIAFIGYALIQIYDMVFRSPTNYDEYSLDFGKPIDLGNASSANESAEVGVDSQIDEDTCADEIANYRLHYLEK